jgi:hypothetical protein
MDTPILAALWPEEHRRSLAAVLRLLEHLEASCMDLGAEDAAAHLNAATLALIRNAEARRRPA